MIMAKKLWGGRFKKETDKEFFEFQKSIQYDHKLAEFDIAHSLIHTSALANAKIITAKEKASLHKALKKIAGDINKGIYQFDAQAEDIHTDIQNKVEKMVGGLALKMHTLRSRNDQVAFDEKMYCFNNAGKIVKYLADLVLSTKLLRAKYKDVTIVGYTHTQRAQRVSFSDYIGAYQCMFERDKKKLENFLKGLNIHIGAGALAGSSIAKNYAQAIKEYLKSNKGPVIKISVNTIDDVSNRDFIIDLLNILSLVQLHLSRLSEDLILYSTKEFNFIDLPEEFCTGSSLMPHKKNPDFLELVRGYTGRVYGNLVAILTTMKGLPLTYNRDMQLDKEPLFSSVEIVSSELKIMARLIKSLELNMAGIKHALEDEELNAVEQAEELVRKHGISFRKAHEIVGKRIADKH